MPLKTWNPADFPEEQQRGVPKWKEGNHVRELLWLDLVEGKIPRSHQPNIMDTREIFLTRPEYKIYGFKNFYDRLHALRIQLHATDSQAARDKRAFDAHARNYPPQNLCARGYPHWEGSMAQQQLKLDVDNGEHEKIDEETMKKIAPKKFWNRPDRPEYREFPLKVFRGHIYQEIKVRKLHNHLNLKEEEQKAKALKKHNKAVERMEKQKQKEKEKLHLEGLTKYSSLRKKLHEGDLKVELLHRGVEEAEYMELRTFTNRRNMLKRLEEDGLAHDEEWKKKAATKGFKKLSAAEFNIPQQQQSEHVFYGPSFVFESWIGS